MSYYFFNRQKLLQKAKTKYHSCGGKEKAANHHLENKDVIKEKANTEYKNFSEEKKKQKGSRKRVGIKIGKKMQAK